MVHYTRLETPAQIRGDLSAVGRSMLMDWLFGGIQKPDTLWLGLATQPINDNTAESDIVEVQKQYAIAEPFPSQEVVSRATGYQRVSYPFMNADRRVKDWISGSNGYYYNSREIKFPTIPSDGYWPQVKSWFITTSPKDGQLFAFGPSGDVPAARGDTVVVPVSGLSFRVPPLQVS